MRKAIVAGGDICTPLGDLESTWNNLLAGRSGLVLRNFGNIVEPLPLGVIDGLTGEFGSWPRMESLFDRLLASLPPLPANTRLFCATTKGAADESVNIAGVGIGQPWQIGDYLAERLGLEGGGTMVSAACASSLIGIIQGAMAIGTGSCDHALIVGVDLLSDFVITGFSSLKALSSFGARPFDRNRDGLSLGDGGGWMLLSAEDCCSAAKSDTVSVAGWAITCDATHITAPSREAIGLISALQQVLSKADIKVGGVNAHGTGTVYNDAMELLAFNRVLDKATPVCSVKGSLGHSLAAAGIVEAVLSVWSLNKMVLPPTVNLRDLESSSCVLSGTKVLSLRATSILTCNSGFGGINGVLLLC